MSLADVKPEAVSGFRAGLGEGPSWDDRTGTLVFVDITAGAILRYDPADGSIDSTEMPVEVGAAIPRAAGGLVITRRDGVGILDGEPPAYRSIAPIESDVDTNRMNDGKCDPQGRLWCGTMAFTAAKGAGAFYRVDADHTVTTIRESVTISNGLGWSPDAKTMYYIDSRTQRVEAMSFDAATGDVGPPRTIITIDPDDGLPDGMTVDAEGCLWVALFGGSQVRRYSPDGTLLGAISMPASQITSACFGGPDLSDLYITSARHLLDTPALAEQPLAGALFVCRPGVTGQPTTSFAG